ncbi:MAG: hypothetical protein ACK5EO_01160, partial [Planctomycetota bacterium]
EAIGAAVDLIKELRQRRLERKARSVEESDSGRIQPIDQNNSPSNKTDAPKRPLRDALKNILGGANPANPSGG